jgi:hypothetical protein
VPLKESWEAGHSGTCLLSQHLPSGGRGRVLMRNQLST